MPVLLRQLNGDMAPISWRTDSNINANIEDRSPRTPHQLALRAWGELKMQASQDTLLRRMDVIILHESCLDSVDRESIRAKGLRKKSPLIAVFGWLHQQNIRNIQPLNLHCDSHR